MSGTRAPAHDQTSGYPNGPASGQVEASRRGAHRTRIRPVAAGLPILAGLLIVFGAIGGTWYVLSDSSAKDSSPSVEAAVPDDEPSGAVPASAGASPSRPKAASSQTPQHSSTPVGSSASEQADHSISIRVLNSVPVKGLAARVASDLGHDDWNVTDTGNSIQKNLGTTKVYYGSKRDKSTARAVTKDLGFGEIVSDPSVATKGLVVVLGEDAR